MTATTCQPPTDFAPGAPTYSFRRGGRVVTCTAPVDWPAALDACGLRFRFEADGRRLADNAPAALYVADEGSRLWFCDGDGYTDAPN
jgi:hypothetical protein